MDKIKQRFLFLILISLVCFGVFVCVEILHHFLVLNVRSVFPADINKHISELDFIYNGKRKKVMKSQNGWITDGPPRMSADPTKINEILQFLATLNTDTKVSNNKERQAEFGITDNRLEVVIDGKITKLYIGSGDLTKNYLRLNDEPYVFEAEGFDDVFTPFDYRDLNLHLVNKEENVTSLKIRWNDNSIELHKQSGEWTVNGKAAIHERVDYLINNIATLKAQDIKEMNNTLLSNSAYLIIELTEGSKKQKIDIYKKNDELYDVIAEKSSYIYEVSAVYIDDIMKLESDLIK